MQTNADCTYAVLDGLVGRGTSLLGCGLEPHHGVHNHRDKPCQSQSKSAINSSNWQETTPICLRVLWGLAVIRARHMLASHGAPDHPLEPGPPPSQNTICQLAHTSPQASTASSVIYIVKLWSGGGLAACCLPATAWQCTLLPGPLRILIF